MVPPNESVIWVGRSLASWVKAVVATRAVYVPRAIALDGPFRR